MRLCTKMEDLIPLLKQAQVIAVLGAVDSKPHAQSDVRWQAE